MPHHLLVTNDFPPKVGGIQSYLGELWTRLPADETTVLTTAHDGAADWDRRQPIRIERTGEPALIPGPGLVRRIDALAEEVGADLVVLDPAWPLGMIAPFLERPYGVIVHGAELTIPVNLPFMQLLVRRTLREASLIIAAGGYPAEQVRFSAGPRRAVAVVPPGVDPVRFHPLDDAERRAARSELDLDPEALVVLGVSRLVPRKGFDVLFQAAARLVEDAPDLLVVIAGDGRDRGRLEGLAAALHLPVRFLGAVPDEQLPRVYGAADLFAMICRDRWLGLEQEGFGIVFLEAAAAGLPAIAGRSGGSAEAVEHGVTGTVVEIPSSISEVEDALSELVFDAARRRRLGAAARQRAVASFGYHQLAATLRSVIADAIAALPAAEPTPDQTPDAVQAHAAGPPSRPASRPASGPAQVEALVAARPDTLERRSSGLVPAATVGAPASAPDDHRPDATDDVDRQVGDPQGGGTRSDDSTRRATDPRGGDPDVDPRDGEAAI